MPRLRGNKVTNLTHTEINAITTADNNGQNDRNLAKEDVDKGESLQNVEGGDTGEATAVIRKWPVKDPVKQHKQEKKPDDLDGGGDNDGDGDDVEPKPIETDVIYPAKLDEELGQEQQNQEEQDAAEDKEEFLSCPPLFVEESSNLKVLPSFPQRLICNADESIGTHPALYFTAFLTILFFCYCACSRRNSQFFKRRRGIHDSKSRGEYTALDVVYNELLDDFDDEEMSSCLQSQDDDSVGTIISQWSEGGAIGLGGPGIIELSSFDDDHLSLTEMNG